MPIGMGGIKGSNFHSTGLFLERYVVASSLERNYLLSRRLRIFNPFEIEDSTSR